MGIGEKCQSGFVLPAAWVLPDRGEKAGGRDEGVSCQDGESGAVKVFEAGSWLESQRQLPFIK